MRILIFSVHGDPHVTSVVWGLRKLGFDPVVCIWSNFPYASRCTFEINANKDALEIGVSGDIVSKPFDVIWARRVGIPTPPSECHPDDSETIIKDSEKYIDNVLQLLSHQNTRWINDFNSQKISERKLFQLRVAKKLGFTIPDTIATNNPDVIRQFFQKHQGEIIHKSFTPARWNNSDGSLTVAKTSKLTWDLLSDDYSIKSCPAIYQENIRKRYEIRVTVMGHKVLAAKIDSQRDGETTDWRCEGGRGKNNLTAFDIDPTLAKRCQQFCAFFGLEFGCIDLIVSKTEEVIFLELNSMGQFLFKEYGDPNLKMLDSFCKFLVGNHGLSKEKESIELSMLEFEKSEDFKLFLEDTRHASSDNLPKNT